MSNTISFFLIGEGYLGCFVDIVRDRVLSGDSPANISMMTILYCIQFCQGSTTSNYTYSGVENGNECYCGEVSDNYTKHGKRSDDQCHVACSGDPTDSCGGVGHIAVFNISATPMTRPTKPMGSSPPPTTSLLTSTSHTAITGHDVISTSSSSSPSLSFSSSLGLQGTSNLPLAGKSTGIGGGVAAVVIIIIIIVVIVCFTRRRSQQRTKGIVSSQRATLTPVSRPPAYDEINDFGISNGAMAEASSARSFQSGAQTHSNANSSRGDKNVLLVNLNPRKSSNIYEGTMGETPEDELTLYASCGTTAVKQTSDNRLSVLYATPDKNGNGAQDGYDEINLGIAPYSSFENPKQQTPRRRWLTE
nr:uncharacterized protein LOC129280024 [Lytechinus pictus]